MNTTTKADRKLIDATTMDLIEKYGRNNERVIGEIMQSEGVSEQRAISSYARCMRKLNNPHLRTITPHKDGRFVPKSTGVTYEVNEMLAYLSRVQGVSLADIIDEAVRQRYAAVKREEK